jgi:uncharacterized SAM-binding protein YcdF (DUF218 family)
VLFVWPPRQVPGHADAVVVLAGGRGPRLGSGLALARGGVAPALVISDGWSATWPEANRLCAGRPESVHVLCFHPGPYSTRGEAEDFARLARAQGWTSAVVVSSRYHIARARMLFERCVAGKVYADGADQSLAGRVIATPSETAKLAYALLVRRGC